MHRTPPCSHMFLAFILKFLNFMQTFIGVSIITYSLYMLNQWNNYNNINNNNNNNNDHHHDHYPQPPVSTPSYSSAPSPSYDISLYAFGHGIELPAPWFIFAFMSLGIVLCCVTCIGHIAAEAINGCCLCFYTFLSAILILIEAAFVAFVALDRHWEKDLPFDPTGELDHFRKFIEENIEISTWVGIFVLIVQGWCSAVAVNCMSFAHLISFKTLIACLVSPEWQALSLFISLLLRAMVSGQNSNYDIEGDYDLSRGKAWEPLLNPQLDQAFASPKSDTWSSRMRKKYGLNSSSSSHNPLN